MPQYTAKVVGMHFREREGVPAKAIVGNMLPGQELTLVREPENPYDAYAIKVLSGNSHIGYIEATVACWAALDLDENPAYCCTVTDFETKGKNLHPIVLIETDL